MNNVHNLSYHALPQPQYGMHTAYDFSYHAPPQSQYATYATPTSAYQAPQPPYSTGTTLREPTRSQTTPQPLVKTFRSKPSQRLRLGRLPTNSALGRHYTKAIVANPPQNAKAVMPARQPFVDVGKEVTVVLECQPRVDHGKDLEKSEPEFSKSRLVGPKRHILNDPDIGAVNDTVKRIKVEDHTINAPSTRPLARIGSVVPSLGSPRALRPRNNTMHFIPSSEDRVFDMNPWEILACDAQDALSGVFALSDSFEAVGLECTIDGVFALGRSLIVTNKSFKNDYFAVEQLQAIAELMSFRLNVVYFNCGEYSCRSMGTKTSNAQVGSTQSGHISSRKNNVHIFCGGGWVRWQGMAKKNRRISSTIYKTLDISSSPVSLASEKKQKKKMKASSDGRTVASEERPNRERTRTLRPRKLGLIYTASKEIPSEDDSNRSEWTPSSSDTDF